MVTTCCNHNLPRAPLAVARLSSSQVIACLKSHPETPRPYGCQYARAYQQSYQNEFQRRAECGALSDHRWRDLSVNGWIEKGKQLFWNSTICAEAGLVNLLLLSCSVSVVSFPLACVDAGLQGISGEIETIGCLYSWQTYCGFLTAQVFLSLGCPGCRAYLQRDQLGSSYRIDSIVHRW